MNSFGLITCGILLGLLAAGLLSAVATLSYLVYLTRRDLASQRQTMLQASAALIQATVSLKTDVTLALSSLDADRLHQSSQVIQRNSKVLASAVNTLSKLVFAQSGAGLDPADPDYTRGMDSARNVDEYDTMFRNSTLDPVTPRPPQSYYPAALSEDDIEAQQAAGISTLDQIAAEEARRQGLREMRAERARIKQENLAAAQQNQGVPLDPLAAARQVLVDAGVDPLTFMPAMDEGTRGRSQAMLPDLDPVGE